MSPQTLSVPPLDLTDLAEFWCLITYLAFTCLPKFSLERPLLFPVSASSTLNTGFQSN